MLRKLKESREQSATSKAIAEMERHVAALAWQANRDYQAWDAARLTEPDDRVSGVQLKRGEVAFLTLEGVGLVEPRRAPSQWVGGSQGVSFKIAKGVRYRVGQTSGRMVQGEERPVVIDTGIGVVTNQRMIFVGGMRTTEWAYSKLLGFSLEQDGVALFNVSNRQKASGFGYPSEVDYMVDAVVSAAIAAFQSPQDHHEVLAELADRYQVSRAAWEAAQAAMPALGPG